MSNLLFFAVCFGLVLCTQAHMSIWVPSMWGSQPTIPTADWAVQPLENYDFVDWWMHGNESLSQPPPANEITQIPAGGSLDFEITGNKWWTTMGIPYGGAGLWVAPGSTNRSVPDPWSNDMNGYGNANIHSPTHADVAGCAIGIAYKSNINDVQPTDFVIVSVVADCIARQLQTFDFPSLPACPNGQCICSWFWIHNSIGGTDQIYMTPFQCNIQNPSTWTIAKPTTPVRCDGQPSCYLYPTWGTITNGCSNSLNPMYWANNQGNNMLNPTNAQCAPVYNASYGFPDGAQNQIFTNAPAKPSDSLGDTVFGNSGQISITSDPYTVVISPGYRSLLTMQGDGNLVLYSYDYSEVFWASNTAGQGVGPYRATVQGDGNFVVYDSTNTPLWSTGTSGQGVGPYRLKLRDQQILVLVDSNSTPLWQAETY